MQARIPQEQAKSANHVSEARERVSEEHDHANEEPLPDRFKQSRKRLRIFDVTERIERKKVHANVTNQHQQCPLRFVGDTNSNCQPYQPNKQHHNDFPFDPHHKYLRTVVPATHCNKSQYIMSQHDRQLMENRPVRHKHQEEVPEAQPNINYRYLPKELILYEDDLRPTATYNGFMIPTQKVYLRQDSRQCDGSQVASAVSYDKASEDMRGTRLNRTYYYDMRHLQDSSRRR